MGGGAARAAREVPSMRWRTVAATPCCGSAEEAADAGTCCAPDAEREATAAGAGC